MVEEWQTLPLTMCDVFQTAAGVKAIKLAYNNTHYLSQPQFLEHMCIPAVSYIHRKIVSWWFRAFACNNLSHHVTDKSAHVSVNGRDGGLEQGWIDSHESQSQQKLEGGNKISYFYCHLKNKHFFLTSVRLYLCKMPTLTRRAEASGRSWGGLAWPTPAGSQCLHAASQWLTHSVSFCMFKAPLFLLISLPF